MNLIFLKTNVELSTMRLYGLKTKASLMRFVKVEYMTGSTLIPKKPMIADIHFVGDRPSMSSALLASTGFLK